MQTKKGFNYIKPSCPRCGSLNTRAKEETSSIKCQHCGCVGHWSQFFEGQKSREIVQKLFNEGRRTGNINKLRGDPLLGSAKKPVNG
ncbi:hypothetical protein ES703_43227 [subsurface metagenome]